MRRYAKHVSTARGNGNETMNKDYHILHHSLGISDPRKTLPYRNHFIAGEGHSDLPAIQRLIDNGLMRQVKSPSFASQGDRLFHVTEKGEAIAIETQPRLPKLTGSKKRYQQYLDVDGTQSFIEWLKDPSWDEYRRTT